nr:MULTISPECIES: acyltransferase [Sphingomonas]
MVEALSSSTSAHAVRARFLALDSLRGLCACMIVLFHLHSTGRVTNSSLVHNSWMFVDFFFVLSGFVISCGYLERLRTGYSVGKFMLLRLGRVYPLHFAILALFLAMEIVGALVGTAGLSHRTPFSDPRTLGELAGSLALVQIFCGFPSIVWNGPSWSIAAEVWTYLLMAVLFRALPRWTAPMAAALAISAGLVLALAGPPAWDPATAYSFARCILGFSLGVLAWMLVARMRWPALGLLPATTLELIATAACIAMVAAGAVPVLAPLLFAATVILFAAEQGLISRLLKLRPFLLLGTLSYSIYMVHTLVVARSLDVLSLVGTSLHHPLIETRFNTGGTLKIVTFAPDLMVFVVLGVVVLVSAATYRWIEAPARDASRKWLSRKGPSSQAPIATDAAPVADRDPIAATVPA